MLFGQSVFQSVLDRLKADDEQDEHAVHASSRIHGFTTGLAFDVMEGVSVASARPGQAYLDVLEIDAPPEAASSPVVPAPEPLAEAVIPAHLTRISPQDVAAELAISARDTVQSLGEKRRAFAKRNHPDGIDAKFRENAAKRMTIANLLIDEAIKRLGR
jgi:hypothetical protein